MSRVMIVGGERSGEYTKWFGHRVLINRKWHVLHRVYMTDDTCSEYYLLEGLPITTLQGCTVRRIQVMG